MDAYDVYGSTQELVAFVDALSNWYVRRSRARFWRAGMDDDKASAYATLYEALVTLAKITAPFTPFASERMFQNLVVGPTKSTGKASSVHLADWPTADVAVVDATLSKKIAAVRSLVSLGLQVRTQAKMKVRQPLRAAHVIVADPALLDDSAREMLADELNVLSTHVYGPKESGRFVEYKLKPNFRSLGQKNLGKEAQELKKAMGALSSADAGVFAAKLMESGKETFGGIELERADVEIEFVSKDGFAAAGDRGGVVVLETTLDDELREKGLVR
jgi:isoleucyl-tRNA synthetase